MEVVSSPLLRKAAQNATEDNRARIFAYYVGDPQRFGIVEFDENRKVLYVEEKPENPKSNYTITGLYFYPSGVSKFAEQVVPSERGELEITSLNDIYLKQDRLDVQLLGRGYSSLKAAADLLVLAYHRTYGLPVTISRCSNNYGPYHFPEKLIPLMIANALADKPLPVYGKGENVCDWLYVEDHCKAIDLIIRKGRDGEVYNVGSHNEMANNDIVKLICRELGKPESLIIYVTDRKGHNLRYAIDPTKIHNELGWLPETKFEDGIKKTIQWYLDNKDWWQKIISREYQIYYEKMFGNR